MPLLTPEGSVLESYPALDDTMPAPTSGRWTVSAPRFVTEREFWSTEFQGLVGVHVDPDEEVESLATLLSDVDVVVLRFSKMADGRPFSKATLLRRRFGYTGRLVAEGPLIPDQFAFLRRCGFDAVQVPINADLATWRSALTRHRHAYQPSPVDSEAPRAHASGRPRSLH